MELTASISIVSFTPFLDFVVQTAYVILHISETLARKRIIFEHGLLGKYSHVVSIYQQPSLVTYLFLHAWVARQVT